MAQFEDLISRGVKPDRVLAWTGNVEPRPDLWSALAARGVESIFGTNGSRAEGLDYRYWDDDDGSEFNKLSADGLPILVTSLTDKTARQVASEIRKAEACSLERRRFEVTGVSPHCDNRDRFGVCMFLQLAAALQQAKRSTGFARWPRFGPESCGSVRGSSKRLCREQNGAAARRRTAPRFCSTPCHSAG